jgi:hypothetical protein
MSKPWLKLWTDILHDRKLMRVDPAWRWCWVSILMLAQEADAGGQLIDVEGNPMANNEIADAIGVDLDTWADARAYFLRLREPMLAIDSATGIVSIVNWQKRQDPDPTHAERQARYRNASASLPAESDASRDGASDGESDASRDGTDIQTYRHTEDRGQKTDQQTPESPPPPTQRAPRAEKRARHRQNGGGGVGDVLICPADYSAEQWAAWNLAVRAAPNFNGLDDFLRKHPPQLVAYWCLAAEDGVPKVENPAGLIRSGVERGDYPRLRGELTAQWQAMIRSGQAWRSASRTT